MSLPRIVIMANSIEELGGAQRVVHVVAQGLAERGYPVDLVGIAPSSPRHEFVDHPAFRRTTLMSGEWPPPMTATGFARLKPSVRRRQAERDALRSEAVHRLGEVLRDGPPGVVVTAQLWAMEHLAQVPHGDWAVVGQYHSSYEAAAAGRDLARAVRLYADVDRVTLLTGSDAERFRAAGLNNTDWLPNPLAFWPQEPVDAGTQPLTLGYLGRLSPEKGPRFLVDAWGRVAEAHPDWRLRVIGSGPDEAQIRAQVAALPVGADRVELLPPVSDAEAALRGIGVLVLPSLTEGLPLSLAEAMALGLPCVAADCSEGVRLLAAGGEAARLVPVGDAEALARALDQVMRDPQGRSRLGARARAGVEQYRSEVILDRWEDLIVRVLR